MTPITGARCICPGHGLSAPLSFGQIAELLAVIWIAHIRLADAAASAKLLARGAPRGAASSNRNG